MGDSKESLTDDRKAFLSRVVGDDPDHIRDLVVFTMGYQAALDDVGNGIGVGDMDSDERIGHLKSRFDVKYGEWLEDLE